MLVCLLLGKRRSGVTTLFLIAYSYIILCLCDSCRWQHKMLYPAAGPNTEHSSSGEDFVAWLGCTADKLPQAQQQYRQQGFNVAPTSGRKEVIGF